MTYYNTIASGYDELYKEEQLEKINLIEKYVKKGDKLLDVGCGTGIVGGYFKDRCDVLGIDNSKDMLKKASIKTVLGSAEVLPFEDKNFDVVISLTTLQNFNDIEKAIKEMERVCKRTLIVSMIKKSTKLNKVRKLLKNYKEIIQEKDIIWIKDFS